LIGHTTSDRKYFELFPSFFSPFLVSICLILTRESTDPIAMFSDARKIWFSASSVIAQALENLDEELNKPPAAETTQEEDENSLQKALNDLNTYKKLLDDAQMQHFELSKQSRILLAEKDAEIQFLKTKLNADGKESTSGGNMSTEDELQYQKLLSEKFILESTLHDTEQKLKELIHEKNEFQVLQMNYQDILSRYEEIKGDYYALKSDMETKEKQKNETIENLVSEYSRLAAETEIMTTQSQQRVNTVMKENEILVTKLAALEHSINELADRTAATSTPIPPLTPTSSNTSSQPPPVPGSPQRSTSNGSLVVDTSEYETTVKNLQKEVKEFKNKIVNLQYDIHEKNQEISKLEQQLAATTTAATTSAVATPSTPSSAPNSPNRNSQQQQQLQQDLLTQQQATSAAMEQTKKLQDELSKQQLASKQQHEADEALILTLKEQVTTIKKELETAESQYQSVLTKSNTQTNEIQALQQEINTLRLSQTSLSSDSSATQSLLLSKEVELQKKLTEIGTLREEIQQMTVAHEETVRKIHAQHQQTLLEEKTKLEKQLTVKDNELKNALSEMKRLEDLHKLTLSGQSESTQSQIAALQTQFEGERSQLVKEKQTLQSDIALLQEQFAEKEKNFNALLANNGENNQLLQDQLKQINGLQDTLTGKKQELEGLQQEKASLLSQVAQKDTIIQELQTVIVGKDKTHVESVSSYTQQLQALKDLTQKEKDTLEQEKVQLNGVITAKDAEIISLQQKITSLEQQIVTEREAAKVALDQSLAKLNETLNQAWETKHEGIVSKLEGDHKNAMAKLTNEKDTFHQSTVTQLKQDHEEAMNAQMKRILEEKRIELETSLASLRATLTAEHQAKEIALIASKEEEKRSALILQASTYEDEKKAMEIRFTGEITVLKGDLVALQGKYDAQEATFQAFLTQQLAMLTAQKDAETQEKLAAQQKQYQLLIDAANAERDEHLANYTKERKLRKKIHNRLLEVQGNIRVICRVRPILEVERKSGEDVDVTEIPNEEELIVTRDMATKTKYEYDRVFGQRSTQEEVFEAVQPLCVSVLDGYNVCIFAYGQTGSGKTYTMEGYGENHGVSPRAIHELFYQVQQLEVSMMFTLTLSMLEIYNETIRDLLDAKGNGEKLDVRQTPEGNSVPGLTEVQVQC
jgi:hypothetical protein